MTSRPNGPYAQGLTRNTMVGTGGCHAAGWSQSQAAVRRPDCSVPLDWMKSESLVIADQHVAVITFPGRGRTARHTMGVGFTRSR